MLRLPSKRHSIIYYLLALHKPDTCSISNMSLPKPRMGLPNGRCNGNSTHRLASDRQMGPEHQSLLLQVPVRVGATTAPELHHLPALYGWQLSRLPHEAHSSRLLRSTCCEPFPKRRHQAVEAGEVV